MKAQVDRQKCKGYALCLGFVPEVFDLDLAGRAALVGPAAESVPVELEDAVRKVALLCPEGAIELEVGPERIRRGGVAPPGLIACASMNRH